MPKTNVLDFIVGKYKHDESEENFGVHSIFDKDNDKGYKRVYSHFYQYLNKKYLQEIPLTNTILNKFISELNINERGEGILKQVNYYILIHNNLKL